MMVGEVRRGVRRGGGLGGGEGPAGGEDDGARGEGDQRAEDRQAVELLAGDAAVAEEGARPMPIWNATT